MQPLTKDPCRSIANCLVRLRASSLVGTPVIEVRLQRRSNLWMSCTETGSLG